VGSEGDTLVIRPQWSAPARVRAAFTLRTGGVSVRPYESLNLGAHVGDAPSAVAENRRRVRLELGLPAEPVWLQQVHGTEVADLDALAPREIASDRAGGSEPPRADAAVTRQSRRVCVIQVADCMPVLFAARDGSAIGAAHAGWRGLAGGVLEATVRKLGVSPTQLLSWLGPTIGQEHFEVGDEVRAAFSSRDPADASAFVANARGRWQCDLYALARRRLAALGVSDVSGGGWCTYADAARFFSYRRDGQCGRMAALIWIG
jgi:purine-nucleoside/S-methyl-5'-thioadenosine phosphorylase / adenosine deaminase